MKTLVALALAVLAASIVGTSVGYLTAAPATPTTVTVGPSTPTTAPTTSSVAPSGPTTPSTTTAPNATTSAPGIAMAEIARHNSSTSCWLLISGRVYDVTTYLRDHPGGSRTILPWCGKESTEAFATEDGKGEHSPDAYAHLGLLDLGPAAP